MKNKKSQTSPINIVIAAALALVILVVLLAIFTGNFGKISQNIGSCITKGGKCASELNNECKEPYPIPLFVSGDCQNSQPKNLCCIKAGTEDSQKIVDNTNRERIREKEERRKTQDFTYSQSA